jgi:hypothetical protein
MTSISSNSNLSPAKEMSGRSIPVPQSILSSDKQYFKTSLRAKKLPSDPVALKKYIYEVNKASYKVRYTGIKVKKHKDLYNSVVEKLNLLTDEDFVSLSRTMINRLKGLNEALIEFQKPEAEEQPNSEVADSHTDKQKI